MNAIIREIERAVVTEYRIDRYRLRQATKRRRTVEARHLVCLVAHFMKYRPESIASMTGKDRCTVYNSLRKKAFSVMTYAEDRKAALKVCLDLDIDQEDFLRFCHIQTKLNQKCDIS